MCRFCNTYGPCRCRTICASCNCGGFSHNTLKPENTYMTDNVEYMQYGTGSEDGGSDTDDVCSCSVYQKPPPTPRHIPQPDYSCYCDCGTNVDTEDSLDDTDRSPSNRSCSCTNREDDQCSIRPMALDSSRLNSYRRPSSLSHDTRAPMSFSRKMQEKPSGSPLNGYDVGTAHNTAKTNERAYKFCGRLLNMPQPKPSYQNVSLSMPMGSRDLEVIAKEVVPHRRRATEPSNVNLPKLKIAFRRTPMIKRGTTKAETRGSVDTCAQGPLRSRILSTRFAIKTRDQTPAAMQASV